MDAKNLMSEYRAMLDNAAAQYQKTVLEAQAQMEKLIAATSKPEPTVEPPQSIWIEKENARYLLMNEAAVEQVAKMLEAFHELIPELQKSVKH